ncbi:MAG: cadmium-translocating P-type ATPase [Rhodospirillales bacterium]|jgi:P-type Cu2+ transporter|nr:cadmium-translocating P-type ATPase [Rhodospirillales bacterium]MBT4627336.1 cadmium-translocating P-type ATPase [Rhodospirillales bacterium]MBT5351100.1 cadmium-translocating P-type ATPase [Rhodospirillales bacterium]MBT5521600.1 cadmium-translocating P-type ATPase [Rhodospirillales bacterium]MBT6110855.1 cadmium-translocating P-type ATPase [Rhodospirillales bacterium]
MNAITPTVTPYVIELPEDVRRLNLMVASVHCAGCIRKIEGALHKTPGVINARVNLSTRRLVVDWHAPENNASRLVQLVSDLGFPATPYDPEMLSGANAREESRLLKSMAVAGFAAANVMLLSIAVWAGYDGGMGDATRGLFHWISAMIALPVVVYSGMPFFKSALIALKGRSLNMDVPISLAVILASGMSLHQTIQGAQHTYFDASVTLLFFLLVGRYLDRRARSKARSAAEQLVTLTATSATIVNGDGSMQTLAVSQVEKGMTVLVAAGDRIPVDGQILSGESDVDASLVTGESLPANVAPQTLVYAGTLNLSQPLTITVKACGDGTLLAEIVRLMEAAEQGRAKYVQIADRVAAIYAPAVHILSAATFIGWMMFTNAGWEASLMAAIAVLIITCPCALGLAVPAVQVVATGRLLQHGVLLKSSHGLERLSNVDTVVFDKTGTLTTAELHLTNGEDISDDVLALAAALAQHSNHPLSRAITKTWGQRPCPDVSNISETPGFGLEATQNGKNVRLGKADWCGVDLDGIPAPFASAVIWLAHEGSEPLQLIFQDTLRNDALETINALRASGMDVIMLSGDRESTVSQMAQALGIDHYAAEQLPAHKVHFVEDLAKAGRHVLMVGDGINDAPALAAGHVSMSPASAADISQNAADLVFQGNSLASIPASIRTARMAHGLVKQNFALAFLYNAIAVPLAMAGLATPLFAAVAMSSSSIVVTLNALRLRLTKWSISS